MDYDFLSGLLDEVALEGLDGITLPILWFRLQNRPNFPIALDDESKAFLWECIAVHKDIEIHELLSPQIFIPIYNRYEHIDSELGIVLESQEKIIDSYPIAVVSDGDIRGSCSTYNSRTCITSEVRYDDVLLMSLSQVIEKWGEKLVLVASPKARLLALIGTETNPLLDISLEQYCLLERIGRSRYLGEVTQGEGGLFRLNAPFCKQLHYHRKKLTLKGLVTKQLHYMKNLKGQATTGSLFHLTRFYTPRKTRMEFLMKCMCDILKEKPNNREQSRVLRQELDITEGTFKKLFYRPFQRCVKMMTLPYKEFFPDAPVKETLTTNGQERTLRVVQLLKHYDEIDNVDYDDITDEKDRFVPLNVHFDFSKLLYDEPLITQVYRIIQEAGSEGITSASVGRKITLPRLDVRTILKELIRQKVLVSVLQERGRQKEKKYIDKNFVIPKEGHFDVNENEGERSQENESHLKNTLKRKNSCSEDDSKQACKKVRFSDEINEVMVLNKAQNQCNKERIINNAEGNSEQLSIQKIVSEVSEIQDSEVFTGKAPKLITLTEKIGNSSFQGSSMQLTDRKRKRMKMVLDNLKSVGLSTLTDLQKFLVDKEREEGYSFKIDKKSTARMIHKLFVAKKLRIYKAILKLDEQKAELEFICDNLVELNDSRIQLAIEQAKFKFFSLNSEKSKKLKTNINKRSICGEKSAPSEKSNLNDGIELEKKTLNSICMEKKLLENQTHPKFLRLKTLHKFLFYLVYNYEGHSGDDSKSPVVYHDSMTWKRFVPPLRSGSQEGWCYLVDMYIRMPLSIFVKVFNLRDNIKYFADFLGDEEKCHYLITDIPKDVIGNLLHQRKYLFAFDEVLKNLCYMGLISFGPQSGKLKQEVYLYINKKAALKDTTISTPGYIHVNNELSYEKKIYSLNTTDDVETFWIDLERISFQTPLGKYSAVAGKTIMVCEANHKPELLEASKNKNFDEVSDVGCIPGDGLGAGGFDSSLFLHSRRNWQSCNSAKNLEKTNKPDLKPHTISIQNLLKNKELLGPEGRSRLQRLHRYRFTPPKDKTLKESNLKKLKPETVKKTKLDPSKSPFQAITQKKKRKMKVRTVKLRTKRIRQPYLDEKDRAAMEKMSRARCEWFAQEDSFLLLCKVASSFLDPTSRTLVVPYTVVRDLLHEKFPDLSENKSSRACQRRVRYMMMNSTTANNVAVFLGEAKQDRNLVKDFEKVTKPPKTNETVWRKLFTGVLQKLLEKFTLPAADRCQNICLPSTMKIFNETFQIMSPRNVFHRKNNHKDPYSEEEVIFCTLYALIVSSMAIQRDGTEWSYLLYKLYQAFPEYVLRSVISRLRNEKVVAVKKRTCKKDLQRSLVSTFPYRFSITYENAFLTKFPIKLFNEAKELIDVLKYIDYQNGLELKGDVAPGYAAAVLSLASLDNLELSVQVPDQIILFDDSLSREARTNIVERMMNTLSDKESVELTRLLNNEKDPSQDNVRKSKVQNVKEYSLADQSENISKKKMENETQQSSEFQRSSNASRFALYLLRQELSQPPIERVQHSQDYIVLNSCKIFCHMKPPNITSTSSADLTHNQNTPSSSGNSVELRTKILTDGCISEIKESLTAVLPSEALTKERNFDESLEKIYDSYSLQTLNDAKGIFEEILKAGSVGIMETEIWKKFKILNGELSLFEHLHLFRESMLVIRAGVASFVYVCMCYAKNWILSSYLLPEICYKDKSKANEAENLDDITLKNSADSVMFDVTERVEFSQAIDKSEYVSNKDGSGTSFQDPPINFTEKVSFLPRTWRHPDGSLNKFTFLELLQTVLSYVISSPGVSVSRVTDRFSLILQPVQTLELLEILEKACCIIKYYCTRFPKRKLFSTHSSVYITKNPDPNDLDHLEPLPDALCNLARLQEAIMQVR